MLLVALATLLLFAYFGYKRPIFALSALAALLPTYLLRFEIFGLPSTVLEFIIWGVFSGSLLRRRRGGEDLIILNPRLQKIKYPLAIFFIASIISVFISPDLFSAVGKWRAFFLESGLFFLVFLSVIKNRRDFEKIIFGLSVSAIYISAISIGQKFFGLPNPFLENVARTSSVFPQPNMLGLYLGPIIILMLGQSLSPLPLSKGEAGGGWIKKLFYMTTIIISFAAIIFAQSDGAIVGVLAGLIIFLVLQNGQRSLTILHNRKVLLGALLLLFIFIFLFFYIFTAQNGVGLKVKNKLLLRDWSGFVRLNIWKESWTMLKDNWLFGAGIAGYPIKILPYHTSREWMDVYPMPHNIILNFWSEIGLMGLAAFLWLLEKFFKMCYNLLKSGSSLWKREGGRDLLVITALSAMLVIIVHGLVDAPYFKNDLSILFWIIYSIPFLETM